MILGGLQKNSLIDFPGTVACVAFTAGCNFKCPYCHNPDLAKGPVSHTDAAVSQTEFFTFLEKRKGLLDGVVITGGEPTLQKDLEAFCVAIRQMGYQIKLDTNGSHPRVVARLLEQQLVDFVAMDIKSNLEGYPFLVKGDFNGEALMETVKILMDRAPSYEFRTTCVRPFIDPSTMGDIGGMIKGASHYVLQHCSQNVTVLNPSFFELENRFFQDQELLVFQKEMEKYVVKCSIR